MDRIGASDAVVPDGQDEQVVAAIGSQRDLRRARVLDGVGDRLGADEIRRRLDVAREPLRRGPDIDGDR